MNIQAVGRVGLAGFKGKVGRRAAREVATRTSFDEDQLAAMLGGVLLAVWAFQTMKTFRAIIAAARGSDEPDVAADQGSLVELPPA